MLILDVGLPKSWDAMLHRKFRCDEMGHGFSQGKPWTFWRGHCMGVLSPGDHWSKRRKWKKGTTRLTTSDIFCVFYFLSTSGRHHFWGESSGHDWLPNKDMVQSRCGGQTYPQVHWILSWSSCSGVNVWNLQSTRKVVEITNGFQEMGDIFWSELPFKDHIANIPHL